jgi:hypothetical protein
MEKMNKLFDWLLIAILCSSNAIAQELTSYDSISKDDIKINNKLIVINNNPNDVIQIFGKNYIHKVKRVKELFPGELEGSYPLFYYDYDFKGLNINYFSYEENGTKYLNYYLITNDKYILSIRNQNIKIGDNISVLETLFPKSFLIMKKQLNKIKSNVFMHVFIKDYDSYLLLFEIEYSTKKIKSITIQNMDNTD